MFFTRIGTVMAHLVFWLSVTRFAISLFVAFGTEDMEANRFFANRYLGAANSGEAMNEAAIGLGIAVALGILVEISKSLKANKEG
ncbi:MAG: hypothetical protein AAGP08_16290 [Pseudomonadota bacterium]